MKDAISAGMRPSLKTYVFTTKVEADGYVVRVGRATGQWRIEILVTEFQAQSDSLDFRPHGFHLSSSFDHADGMYVFWLNGDDKF